MRRPAAVVFDRDGTLVVDVAHNADPARVVPMPTAREAVELLRRARIPTAVVTNQSVIGRGWASAADVDATNRRVVELLGPLGRFHICPHTPDDGCACRKPHPRLLLEAARDLGIAPGQLVFIGDRGSDMVAAHRAGAQAILVPSEQTPPADVADAPRVAGDLLTAVEQLLADTATTCPG